MVTRNINSSLRPELEGFIKDLEDEGWSVVYSEAPDELFDDDLKKYLNDIYRHHHMSGVVLVGGFPYEDGSDENDFTLSYDDIGEIKETVPRFWVSRIDNGMISVTSEEEAIDWLKNYFSRNHDYRKNYKERGQSVQPIGLVTAPLNSSEQSVTDVLSSTDAFRLVAVDNEEDFFRAFSQTNSSSFFNIISMHGNPDGLKAASEFITKESILYNYNSNAKLLVISSCRTGKSGQGLTAATAFLYAQNSETLAVIAAQEKTCSLSVAQSAYTGIQGYTIGEAHLKKMFLFDSPCSIGIPGSEGGEHTNFYSRLNTLMSISYPLIWKLIQYRINVHTSYDCLFGKPFNYRLVLFGDGTIKMPDK